MIDSCTPGPISLKCIRLRPVSRPAVHPLIHSPGLGRLPISSFQRFSRRDKNHVKCRPSLPKTSLQNNTGNVDIVFAWVRSSKCHINAEINLHHRILVRRYSLTQGTVFDNVSIIVESDMFRVQCQSVTARNGDPVGSNI